MRQILFDVKRGRGRVAERGCERSGKRLQETKMSQNLGHGLFPFLSCERRGEATASFYSCCGLCLMSNKAK